MIRTLIAPALALVALLATLGCSSEPAPTPRPTGSALPSPTLGTPRPPTPSGPGPTDDTPPSPTPTLPAGLDWSAQPLPVGGEFSTVGALDVAVLDGVFLAAGVGWREDAGGVEANVPLFWRSNGGQAWELLEVRWPGGYVDALTTWQGRYLAAGYVGDERSSAAFWTSPDGDAWERLPDQPVLQFFRGATEGRDIVSGGISHVRSDGEELIARGWLYCACATQFRDGAVEWRTSDGHTWQRTELGPGQDVAPPAQAAAGLLRIADGGSAIELSPDGSTWQTAWAPLATTPDDDPSVQLFALGARPGGWLAVGVAFEDDVSRPLVLSSSDGLSWARSGGPGIDDAAGALVDFAAGGSAVVAVGRAGDPSQPFVWRHVVP